MQNTKWLSNIKPKIGYYLSGFVDGEGSFNVSLKKREDHSMGWQVYLSFSVSQKESYILSLLKKNLGCGKIRQRKRDNLFVYEVNNPLSISERVIPFFKRFNFLSQNKKRNFSIFCQIVELVFKKEHLNKNGLQNILKLRETLNISKGRSRKYNKKDINNSFIKNPQRLYARPRAFRLEK